MPDNNIEWGQGGVNNSNDWGKAKANSTNNFGAVYDDSPSGDTNIAGGAALTITYSASAYCDGIGDTPQPTVAGNTGSGTFSSTAGLIINSTTGVIDVDASTDGATYVITYTDTDSDTATANVTLNALDNAAFAYSASSYEPTDADPTPTITGLTGGTFSAGSGLVFVDSGTNTGSSTGEIDLSASTIASYTITYDTTSSGSSVCPNTSTQTVEIALAGIANNYSMNFDIGSYIDFEAGNTFDFNTNDFSVSFWMKKDGATGSYQPLIDFGGYSQSPYNQGSTIYSNTSNKIHIYNRSQYLNWLSTITSTSTGWNHICIVRNGANLILYISNSTEQVSETLATNVSSITFGGSNRSRIGGPNSWSGKIDEVAVWNTALTSTQVSEIYSATGTNLTKDLTTVSGSNLIYWNRMGD